MVQENKGIRNYTLKAPLGHPCPPYYKQNMTKQRNITLHQGLLPSLPSSQDKR
jgi:hypothetical protein